MLNPRLCNMIRDDQESNAEKSAQEDLLVQASEKLFNSPSDDLAIPTDVKFYVGNKKLIEAHKFMLALRSPVFNRMFYGQLAESNDFIRIPDVQPNGFTNLLRYIYADQVVEELSDFSCTYRAADKYLVNGLCKKLLVYIKKALTLDNALLIYEQIRSNNLHELQHNFPELIDIIKLHSHLIFNSNRFLELNKDTLIDLLQSDSLSIDEIDLFTACVRWMNAEKIRKNLSNQLFDELKKLIRFTIMSRDEFFGFSKRIHSETFVSPEIEVIAPAQSGLFTVQELEEFKHYFETNDPLSTNYNTKRRDDLKIVRLDFDWRTKAYKMADEEDSMYEGDILYRDKNGHFTDSRLSESQDLFEGNCVYFEDGFYKDDLLKDDLHQRDNLNLDVEDDMSFQDAVSSTSDEDGIDAINESVQKNIELNSQTIYLYKIQTIESDLKLMIDEKSVQVDNYRKNNCRYMCFKPIAITPFTTHVINLSFTNAKSQWFSSKKMYFKIDQVFDQDGKINVHLISRVTSYVWKLYFMYK